MAWAFVQKASNGVNGDYLVDTTLNGTTAGNFLVVNVSFQADPGTWVISGGGLTYVSRYGQYDSNQGCGAWQWYVASLAGGNVTVRVDSSPHSALLNIFVSLAEFSGGNTSPASGSTNFNLTDSTSIAKTGSISPPDSNVLILANMGNIQSGTVTENQGGQGFTLIDEDQGALSGSSGSAVYKIISGAPGSVSHTWTTPGNAWCAGIAAYKPGAASLSSTPTAGSSALSGVSPARVQGTIFTPYTP